MFQVARDLGFMIPDILHVIIPLCSLEVKNSWSLPGIGFRDPELKLDILYLFGSVIFGLCLYSVL